MSSALQKAAFISGTAIGSDGFIRQLVGNENAVLLMGYTTQPVNFIIGDNRSNTLRKIVFFIMSDSMEAVLMEAKGGFNV